MARHCFRLTLLRAALSALALVISFSPAWAQNQTDRVIDAGRERLRDNQKAQQQVTALHEQTTDLVADYQNLLKVVEGLEVYNGILARQLANQQNQIQTLEGSIANAAVIERQILPLLTRMLDGLASFVELDVPFLTEERRARVVKLRRLIDNANLSNAEKTRRVFEALQIENDYGNTIETYKGKLSLAAGTFDVDFLRVGRIALTYRTVGGDGYGYWDKAEQRWQPLTASHYQRNIDKGIKMARQELAPELLTLPIGNSAGARP